MINRLPLQGRRIVITRSSDGVGRLARRLEALGAEILELPLVEVEPWLDPDRVEQVFGEIGQYEWLIFTSAHGVRYFFEAFFKNFEDIRSLGFLRLAAIGESTAQPLRDLHLKVDVVPKRAVSEDLAEALLKETDVANLRLLVIVGNRNRDTLVRRLEKAQALVDSLQVYRTGFADLATHPVAQTFRQKGADALIFSSSSAVKSFGEQASNLQLEPGAQVPALCSFGPQTSQTMREAGIPLAIEAESPTVDALVEALVAKLAP